MSKEIIINPYENIVWDKVNGYKGNFHQHSTESDGREYPANLIDQAKDLGMDIFVISDHDSYRLNRGKYPKVLDVSDPSDEFYDPERPEGLYRNIYPFHYFDRDVYYDPNEQGNYTELARRGRTGEFDIIDNKVKDMLTFEACEFTEKHHIISILTNEDGFPGGLSEEELIRRTQEKGGLTYFAHPGRHWEEGSQWYNPKYTPKYYRDIITDFRNCLGIEVSNMNDRFPNDKKLWDVLSNVGFDTIEVWGFSGTDSHNEYNDNNYNVVFMEELTISSLKNSLINGNFYFCDGEKPPTIKKIEVNDEEVIITSNGFNIDWYSSGKKVAVGSRINYKNTKGLSNNLRAVVYGKRGRAFTNPFYFSKFANDFRFI